MQKTGQTRNYGVNTVGKPKMTSLREKMAEHGFESNENYDYAVSCLQTAPGPAIRCLNIEGEAARRNTAFASALAYALEPKHVLYHDFTQQEDIPAKPVTVHEDDIDKPEEPPVGLFDRIMSDACAFSEAEKTVLIIDQLQAADFKEHIRVYQFLIKHEWRYRDAVFYANRQNLLIFIISEEPLYHSLQKHSFKIWVSATSNLNLPFKPTDLGLNQDAQTLLALLHDAFKHLGIFPTHSEYKKIIHDIRYNVRTADHLKTSIYGWMEGADRDMLHSEQMHNIFQLIMPAIEAYIGVEESVELSSENLPDNK